MKFHCILAILLLGGLVHAAEVTRHEKCSTEGMVAKTASGAIMTCQNGRYEHTVFKLINVQLVVGQIAQDPKGCLYSVTEERDTFSLKPVKGDDGKQLCGRLAGSAPK